MCEGLTSVRWILGEGRWERAPPPPHADSRQEMGVLLCSVGKPSAGKCGQIAGCLAVSCCGSEALGWSPGEDCCATPGGQGFCIWFFSSHPKWREACEREKIVREEEKGTAPLEREDGVWRWPCR